MTLADVRVNEGFPCPTSTMATTLRVAAMRETWPFS